MKKTLKMIGMTVLLSLSCLTMTAQLDGSGFYRVRNAANTNHYISLANDLFNYHVCISNAGGGLWEVYGSAGRARAMTCAGLYLQTDIHMVDDSEYINPGAVIYADQKVANGQYNLIGQGTCLLTLTTGTYDGTLDLEFQNLYVKIASSSGSGANTQYTASMVLKASNNSMANLGTRYFVDNDGTFAISESSSATNAKWYIDPVDHFNIVPDMAFNGKYYTTLYVPYAFTLSGQVLNAYVIKAVGNGTLNYERVATSGGTVPAGTPVLLECASSNPADCQLIPTGIPLYTAPDLSVTSQGAPRATSATNYTGTNILKGTYFCNTDGSLVYQTNGGTSSFNANNNIANTNPQKYVIGVDESGKLGFVKATTTPMPANKAWLETGGLFPTVATPVIEPASGTYNEAKTVTITAEEGATIHYTVDGTVPTASSPVYSEPFTVSETTTVNAIAVKEGLFNNSDVATAEYVIESSVTHYKPGDVNHDNKVDIDDVTMLIDSVLGKPSGICEVCADLDGNSKVDIDDVTAAITIVLTGSY